MSRKIGCCFASIALLAWVGALAAQPPEMPRPSPEHELLKKMAGTWDATMKMGPMESKCVETSKMLGDFWLVGNFEGEFSGMKFTGHSMMGYDPNKKKYINTWVDSFSPHFMKMEGDFDKDSKTMTFVGEGIGMDGKPTKNKTVTKCQSDDQMHFTMYEEKDGKWTESFTIQYKRRANGGVK
jgi:hypothetical protein